MSKIFDETFCENNLLLCQSVFIEHFTIDARQLDDSLLVIVN